MNDLRSVAIVILLMAAGLSCADRTALGTAGAPDDYQVRPLMRPSTPWSPVLDSDPPLDHPAWIVRVSRRDHMIRSIAVTDQYLYFTALWEGVYRVAKAGGPLEVVEAARTQFEPLTTTPGGVFWTRTTFDEDNDYPHVQIKHRADAGGPASVLFEGDWGVTGSDQLSNFQTNTTSLYMIAGRAGSPTYDLHRLPIGGGTLTPMLELPSSHDWPSWIVDESRLFFVGCTNRIDCTLQALPRDGGEASELASFPEGGILVAADADSLYVLGSYASRSIARVSKQGGGVVQTLAATDGRDLGRFVLVDDQNVYYTATRPSGDPELRAQPKDGRAAFTIAKGALFASCAQIVQDRDSFYVLRGEAGEVSVVPKPL
jgi:hypothetical protein